jgi:hypothetical protein
MGGMQPSALRIKVVIVCAAHELQIAVRFVSEKEDWRSIHDMLASEATLVRSEGVSGK